MELSGLQKNLRTSWFAHFLAGSGGLVFFLQLLYYIRTQASVLDEGMYLVEGYLFSVGRYIPFQDFGIRMYQLPMAYLIPGYIQRWFGPGLRTGRYFAVLLACLMLLGLWLTARRLGGIWLAALAVWIFALNPAPIKLYSQADSEGLAACILMGCMAFTLGEKRPAWKIAFGSFLAGILITVRVNLLPVIPFLILYVVWQNGWKLGLLSAAFALLPLVGIHLLYWPNILRIWAYWLPEQITPFLNPWRPPSPEILSLIPGVLPRINSFTQGLRLFFVTFTGIWISWIAWPRRSAWKSLAQYRIAVFLSALFIVLALMHLWATVLINNCVFCLPEYLSFFIGLGVLILTVSFSSWVMVLSTTRQKFAYVVILSLLAAWGYSLQLVDFLNHVLSINLARRLMNIKAPIVHGHHEIYIYVANALDIAPDFIFRSLSGAISALLGVMIGCILILIVWRAAPLLSRLRFMNAYSTSMRVLLLFMVLGLALSPTPLLGASDLGYDCGGDVIASMEAVGAHLKQFIPDNALVNWDGPDSPVLLLYIPTVRIFPPQLTGAYEWREEGDPIALARYGLWDREIAGQFLDQSDYAIAWGSYLAPWQRRILERSGNFEKLPNSPPVYMCYKNRSTRLEIFKKKP